jgi:hypothetical protein
VGGQGVLVGLLGGGGEGEGQGEGDGDLKKES